MRFIRRIHISKVPLILSFETPLKFRKRFFIFYASLYTYIMIIYIYKYILFYLYIYHLALAVAHMRKKTWKSMGRKSWKLCSKLLFSCKADGVRVFSMNKEGEGRTPTNRVASGIRRASHHKGINKYLKYIYKVNVHPHIWILYLRCDIRSRYPASSPSFIFAYHYIVVIHMLRKEEKIYVYTMYRLTTASYSYAFAQIEIFLSTFENEGKRTQCRCCLSAMGLSISSSPSPSSTHFIDHLHITKLNFQYLHIHTLTYQTLAASVSFLNSERHATQQHQEKYEKHINKRFTIFTLNDMRQIDPTQTNFACGALHRMNIIHLNAFSFLNTVEFRYKSIDGADRLKAR